MEPRGASSVEWSLGMWESSDQELRGSRTSLLIPSWLVPSTGRCLPAQEEPFLLSMDDQMSLVCARAGSDFHLSCQIYSCPNGFLANPSHCPGGRPSLAGGGRSAGSAGLPRAASLTSAAPNARTSRRSPAGVQPRPELGERDRKALAAPRTWPGRGGRRAELPAAAQPHTAPHSPHMLPGPPPTTSAFTSKPGTPS